MKKHIKQLVCLLMAAIMAFSVVACGGSADEENGQTQNDTSSTVADETTEAPAEMGANQTVTATLWELSYDDADGWVYDAEENYWDGESCSRLTIRIPDAEDEERSAISVYIRVSIEEPYSFRDSLVDYGFDEYEYEVNHAYEMTSVGGVGCLTSENESWGSSMVRYLGRDEAAGATIYVEIMGETADARVEKLLSGLRIHLTDVGNEDGPWYWEGEPFSTQEHQTMVGTYTLTGTWIPFQENLRTYETFEHTAVIYGEVAYVLSNGALKQYAYDGTALSNGMDIALDDEYSHMNLDNEGNLWLSDFGAPLTRLTNGEKTASYDGPDYVVMDPTGTWGISWFTSAECEKLTLTDGILSTEPITFAELKMVNRVFLDENNIYVCGSAADDSGHKVFVYDHEGNFKLSLADEDGTGLGSITFVAETDNGFLALDGNMREVVLWNREGAYIGAADDADLFGTNYPWFCGASKLDDGSFLVIMTDDRMDKSAMELLAFRLSGF